MNTIQKRSLKSLLAVMLVLALGVKGGVPAANSPDPGVEKKKTLNFNYTVNSSEKLKIVNSFGSVHIKKGNTGEIKVTVEVTVKCSSDELAQKTLNDIQVKEKRSGGAISLETELGWKNQNGRQREFTIDYTVLMPAENPLYLDNSFGTIHTEDRSGLTTINCDYGKLEAGNIANNGGISVAYGSAKIGSVTGGKINFQYCGDLSIGAIGGDAKLICAYSSGAYGLGTDLKSLTLITSYASTRVNLPPALPASFTIRSSFGEVRNTTAFPLKKEPKDEDNRYSMDSDYSGTAGDGSVKVNIRNSFGEVRIMNPGEPDKQKEKNKNKPASGNA